MNGVQLGLVLIVVLSGLYGFGLLPSSGLVRAYRRIQLVGLAWAAIVVVIGVSRIFNIV